MLPLQVTEISNVKCITRLPKETKRQAVAIIFTDDSARTFTCDSGRRMSPMVFDSGLQWAGCRVRVPARGAAGLGRALDVGDLGFCSQLSH